MVETELVQQVVAQVVPDGDFVVGGVVEMPDLLDHLEEEEVVVAPQPFLMLPQMPCSRLPVAAVVVAEEDAKAEVVQHPAVESVQETLRVVEVRAKITVVMAVVVAVVAVAIQQAEVPVLPQAVIPVELAAAAGITSVLQPMAMAQHLVMRVMPIVAPHVEMVMAGKA